MSGTPRTVAVTGGTGFLGQHAVAELARQGWRVRLLSRREPAHASWAGLVPEVLPGSLSDAGTLARLVRGCDAVLHLAGLIKARDDAEFLRVNRDGTRLLAEAVRAEAPSAHFLHVSSLAARSPELSGYALSKRAGEEAVFDILDPSRFSVIRPPAIYGPGDRETLTFFHLASGAVIPLPRRPAARFALIHVEDASRFLAACLEAPPTGRVHALSDDRPSGYSWRDILETAVSAVGNNRPRFLPLPASVLRGVGGMLGWAAGLGGPAGMINAGKIRELLHEDWAVHGAERLVRASAAPEYSLARGFAETARWYRHAGWL
ncbi:MAG: NAD-dependent epimerase/dehydratase family protein [Nevskia sp.]